MQGSPMKLNKISALFNNTRTKANNLAIFGAALTAMLAAPVVSAQSDVTSETQDVEVIQVQGIAGSLAESARQKRFDQSI